MPPCPAPDTCWLYLIRHGATANNRACPPRLQGRRTDPGLSEEGRQQARLTAEALADQASGLFPRGQSHFRSAKIGTVPDSLPGTVPDSLPGTVPDSLPGTVHDSLPAAGLSAVYSSPLLRARETAEAIALPHGLRVDVVDELVEVDVGQWEGHTWEEIQQMDPDAYRLFAADAGVNPYLGGENFRTVQARAVPAIERLLADNLGRVVVAVGHNCVNRAYLAHLLEMPLANYRLIPQDNCCINLLRRRNGQTRLVTLNAVGHLGAQ